MNACSVERADKGGSVTVSRIADCLARARFRGATLHTRRSYGASVPAINSQFLTALNSGTQHQARP